MYTIERLGVIYEVSPYEDEGQLFAVIHSATGLESFGSDELASMFNEEAHKWLAAELKRRMIAEASISRPAIIDHPRSVWVTKVLKENIRAMRRVMGGAS